MTRHRAAHGHRAAAAAAPRAHARLQPTVRKRAVRELDARGGLAPRVAAALPARHTAPTKQLARQADAVTPLQPVRGAIVATSGMELTQPPAPLIIPVAHGARAAGASATAGRSRAARSPSLCVRRPAVRGAQVHAPGRPRAARLLRQPAKARPAAAGAAAIRARVRQTRVHRMEVLHRARLLRDAAGARARRAADRLTATTAIHPRAALRRAAAGLLRDVPAHTRPTVSAARLPTRARAARKPHARGATDSARAPRSRAQHSTKRSAPLSRAVRGNNCAPRAYCNCRNNFYTAGGKCSNTEGKAKWERS